MKLLKQSSTAQELLFLMIDSADHVSPKTGLSPTVTIRKAGGSFASPSGAVSEIANGWYKVAGNATDTNTLGPLLLHASATGADPSDVEFAVVAFDPQDAVRIGMSSLPNAAAEAAGGLYTRGTGAGQIAQQANGQIDVNLSTVKTQAVTCAAGVTVLAQVGAAAAPGTNGGLATVDASNRIAGIQGTKNRLDDMNDLSAAGVRSAVGLASANLDTQIATLATLTKLLKYVQLLARKDAAIATDNATELTAINANGGSGAGGYDNTTDAQEALRDRGDAAWITVAAATIRSAVGLASANLDTQLGTLATPAQVKTQVVDALATDTYAEPAQGAPAATTTLAAKINYLYKNWRNKKTQTSSQWSLLNDDAATVDHKATVSDDGTTAAKGEIAAGP